MNEPFLNFRMGLLHLVQIIPWDEFLEPGILGLNLRDFQYDIPRPHACDDSKQEFHYAAVTVLLNQNRSGLQLGSDVQSMDFASSDTS